MIMIISGGGPLISRTAEYALRAVIYLSRVKDRRPIPVDEIAEVLDAPRNYLSKTLHELAKGGVLKSLRGPTGGFSLAADPEVLTVADLADWFDEPRLSGMCLLGGRLCDRSDPCGAHERWSAAWAAARAPIAAMTIAQLAASAPPVVPGPRKVRGSGAERRAVEAKVPGSADRLGVIRPTSATLPQEVRRTTVVA